MPSKTVKAYAEQSGKSVDEVEKIWDETKKEAKKKFPKGEEDPDYWAYVNATVRKKLGLDKKKTKKAAYESWHDSK